MNNRQKLIQRLEIISPELKNELSYYLEIDHEDKYDIADAFDDYSDFISQDGRLPKELKHIYIDIGYVQPVDVSKIVSNGKKYWFQLNGVKYQGITYWENWINS